MPAAAIELRGVDKRFGPVHANKNINLEIPAATIHGIIGENGAGKSTLMSILYGFYEADSGEIWVAGKRRTIRSSQDAIQAGIGMVHQHFMLVDRFSVLENIVLGAETGPFLNASVRGARHALAKLEQDYGLEIDADAIVADLPVGLQQRVEILKALYRGARILILDEPTSVLTPQEADQLFAILRALRAHGTTVVLITHKLREIIAITDNVSVMRGGAMVAHQRTADTSKEHLAELMVGRKISLDMNKTPAVPKNRALTVTNLSVVDARRVTRVDTVSFDVRGGEIVGIAGVSGNGQSELLAALSGIQAVASGSFAVNGNTFNSGHPADPHTLRKLGLAHVPEDRLRHGLIGSFSAAESAILGYQDSPQYNRQIFLNRQAIHANCHTLMEGFDVRPPNSRLKTANFSGGNQQKIVVGRELRRQPTLLLVGQPTRGVDIGAIEFIYRKLLAMRDAGAAIVVVSVELDEVMTLADRILVMFEGRIVGEVSAAAASERQLGLMMANAHDRGNE